MTANIPKSKWTQTAINAEKRRQRAFDESFFGLLGKEWHEHDRQQRAKDEARLKENRDYFNKNILSRVRKQHPELNKIKSIRYAKEKDPIGRKFNRLSWHEDQTLGQIKKAMGLDNKGRVRRPSSGRSGG